MGVLIVQKKRNYYIKLFLSLLLTFTLILTAGCGGKKENTKTKSDIQALKEVNEIPEDGIITKEQFKTVAGEEKQIQFTGQTEDGILYVWTYYAAQIQNPEDQNLKIDFTSEELEDIKTQANHANDAIKLTMHGKGLICIPTLTITLPEAWQSDTGLLLKEQGGNLARMSDVTVESKPEEVKASSENNTSTEDENKNEGEEADTEKENSDKNTTDKSPQKGETILSMQVTSLDGDCYIVGGIAGNQNKGADTANGSDGSKATTAVGGQAKNQAAGNTSSGSQGTGNQSNTQGNGQQSGQGGSQNTNNDADNQSADDGSGDIENDIETQQSSHTCTISISCATILNNLDNLTSGKEEFVPADGWILAASTVEFEEGESVHDVLKRVCKEAGIHMESSYTPAYNSAYVEGINQLYEFDCGEYSGWMYKVNGWFPNYGCSKYTVSDGDVIDWVYTCDLGKDVGDNSIY